MRYLHTLWLFTFFLVTSTVLFAASTPEMPVGLEAAYQQARHQIEVIEEKGKPTRWRAVNAGNHLSVDFDGKGIVAHSLKDDWRLSMELTQLGEPDQLKPINKPTVQIKNNHLTYDRGTIREWYINDPKGLEQGFTLDKPLAEKQLVLQFALGGDVKPKLIEKGKALQLITPQGKKLRYEGLKAWDAKGRDLNATLQLKENSLQLQVAVVDAVYPITIDPWLVEEHKLMAGDAEKIDDMFGISVAISGNTAVIGAHLDDGDDDYNSGSAYVFTKDGNGSWSQQAKLTARDAEWHDHFGISVAISGNTTVIGAYLDDDDGLNSGSAYVFTRNGNGIWSHQAKLTAQDAAAGDWFGWSVAISGDTALVGAHLDDDGSGDSGSAYIFVRNGGWSQQAKLTASNAAAWDYFGWSVAISGDKAVVGAPLNDSKGTNSGSVYVYTGNWSQEEKLTASDAAAGDHFGHSVAISGSKVLVGAPFNDGYDDHDNVGHSSGSAYVFTHDRDGSWNQQAKLLASDAATKDEFGYSVAISGDTAVVGARFDDDGAVSSGSAYVFTRNGSWNQQTKLLASDAAESDRFGWSVAISGDKAVVGAPFNDEGGRDSGSAYVFSFDYDVTHLLPSNQWHQISLPNDPGANNTVTAAFGDDITGNYGTDWVLYRYDGNGYIKLDKNADVLKQGVGYWIIQVTGTDNTLDLPMNSPPTPITHPTGCLATAEGCFEIPLTTQNDSVQWNMIGYPFKTSESLANVRILTDTAPCTSGCELDAQNLVHNQLWTYNGSTYTLVNTSDNLEPWTGYWSATLSNADPTVPELLVPKP